MEALLRRHRLVQHVQTDRAHQLGMKGPGTHSDLTPVRNRLLRGPVQLVVREFPALARPCPWQSVGVRRRSGRGGAVRVSGPS